MRQPFYQRLYFFFLRKFRRIFRALRVKKVYYNITRYPLVISPNLGLPAMVPVEKGVVKVVMGCVREAPRRIRRYFTARGAFKFRNVHTRELHAGKVVAVKPHKVGRYSYLRSVSLRNIFGPRDLFYTIKIQVPPAVDVTPPRRFALYDLIYTNPNGNEQVNYHSVCLTTQDWENFSFVQLSDVHVAKRNDEIFDIIASRAYGSVDPTISLETYFARDDNEIFFNPRLRRVLEYMEFLNRANNFNNNLRQTISLLNREARQGRLDFIVMTGDLVDFVRVRLLGGRFPGLKNNWEFLQRLLIGQEDGEELEVPVFTVVGNHDFRVNSYAITGFTYLDFAAEFRSFRLTRAESRHYRPLMLRNPLRANSKALVEYHRRFNPKLDFFLHLGNYHFLFYNSGYDSFVGEHSFTDIIGGNPDTSGLLNLQLAWFKRYVQRAVMRDDHTIVLMHAPPVSYAIKYALAELNQESRQEQGLPAALDASLREDIGTINNNRREFILATLGEDTGKRVDMVLTGHVHRPAEYHPERLPGGPDLDPRYRYHVFADAYSRNLENLGGDPAAVDAFWEETKPLYLSACALGPANSHVPSGRVPAYRCFTIRDGRVTSTRNVPVRADPFILLSVPHNATLEVLWRNTRKEHKQGFSGHVLVDIANADFVVASHLLCEVEIRFRGRGITTHPLEEDFKVVSTVGSPGPVKRYARTKGKKRLAIVRVLKNVTGFEITFAGEVHYGKGLFKALTGIILRVRVLGTVKVGAHQWKIVGDELEVRKFGLVY